MESASFFHRPFSATDIVGAERVAGGDQRVGGLHSLADILPRVLERYAQPPPPQVEIATRARGETRVSEATRVGA